VTRSLAAVGGGEALPQPAKNVAGDLSGGSPVGTGSGQCGFESPPACMSPATLNAAHVIAAVEAFHQAHRDCFWCSLLEGAE